MTNPATGATLILGGSGFLGAQVVAAALARAHRGGAVYSASRQAGAAPRIGAEHALPFDALHADAVEDLFAEVRPARVVLCTALAKLAECEAYPELARALNVELPRRVATECATSGARLVTVSTDLVFGGGTPRASGYREDDPPAPVSHYGRTKTEGETAVLAAYPRALVVRVPLLFGPSGGRGLGASDSLLAAIARGERPRLSTDEWRTPLSVVEAASALCELLEAEVSGRLHVAGPDRITRYELGLWALRSSGFSPREAQDRIEGVTSAELAQKEKRPADACLDTRRARSFLATQLTGFSGDAPEPRVH